MSVAQILSMCRERAIQLRLDGEELKLVGQRERLDDSLIALIRGHKPELIRLLATQAAGSAPPATQSGALPESIASRTEELLASLWRDLFGREHIAASAHFFELGGHSLLATRLVNRIRAKFCSQVDLGAVFRYPVLADLARHIDGLTASQQQQAVRVATLPPIVRRSGSRAPLSYAQQGLWLIDRIEQGSAHYGQLTAYRILGNLNRAALLESLRRLVERHDALRTRFVAVDGEPCQFVNDAWTLSVSERDLTGLEETLRGAALTGLIAQESALQFDLTSGVLVRVILALMGPGEAVLLLNLHHIAGDGWSVGLLIEELQVLYAAALEGQVAMLPELPVRYMDYARWQRELFHGERLRIELDFWRELMQGAPPLHDICLDRVRPEIQTHHGAELRTLIGAETCDALKRLASSLQTTLFICLESLFALFVARLSGCADVVIGTPVSGRWHPDIERVVGLFANTIPLRHKVDGSQTLLDCLRQSHATVTAVLTHQHCPFELLVDQLGVERSLAYSPVFQIVFALHDDAAGQIELAGLVIERMALQVARSKFDLLLAVRVTGQGLRLEWQYDTTLFDGRSIELMAAQFAAFLESAVRAPEARVSELSLLSELDRQVLAAAAPPLGVPSLTPAGRSVAARSPAETGPREDLYSLFAKCAAGHPQAIAVEEETRRSTYGELLEAANTVAAHLISTGVTSGDRVGLYLPRGLDLIQCMLGIAQIGATYVPLDTSYPMARLRLIASDAQLTTVISTGAQSDRLAALTARVVDVAHLQCSAQSVPTPCALSPESVASLMYASGSSVVPEGVMVPHRAIIHLVHNCGFMPLDERTVMLQLAPVAFAAATLEIWGPLLNGGRMVIYPDGEPELARLGGFLASRDVNALCLPAALFDQWVTTLSTDLPQLRHVITAGDIVTPSAARRLYELLPRVEVISGYGPTENTTFACCYPIPRSWPDDRPVPIGYPIRGTGIRVLDERLEERPLGAAGELYICGAGLALGYWRNETLTRAKFIHDTNSGQVLYRTGDRVRRGHDGTLHFAARRPAPAAVVELPALPIGAHGKLDRRARPRPEGGADLRDAHDEPEGELERLLAQVWSQLLGIERVGAGDSFFGLGGNSLSATRMVSTVQARTGIKLPLREVYQRGSVRQLASWLAEHPAAPADLAIEPVPRGAPLAASYAQQRLWFIDRMEGGSAQYNMPALFEVRGALNLEALQAAVDRLVERHEILRTVYAEVDGVVAQIIAPAGPVAVRYHDLRAGDLAVPGATVEPLIEHEALGVFDLRNGPVLRVTVLRLGSDEYRLLFNMHHIAADGWSIAVLTRDLMALYAAASHGTAGPLEPGALQFADYAHWQRLQLSGESREHLSGYWHEQLHDIPTLHRLPTDRPRPPRITTRGASLKTALDARLSAGLKHLASSCGVSLFTLLQATFALLLARISGERDIVMGTPMAGRERAELEQMVGCFVNTVVLRNRVPAHGSFKTFLAETHAMVLGALEHQRLPFDMLVEHLNPPRSASHLPLMQLWFVMQNMERIELALPGMQLRQLPLSEISAKFDLMLSVTEEPDGTTELYWVYNVALFDAPTIHSWAESFGVLAAGVAAEPDTDVATLPVLSAGQRVALDSYSIDVTMDIPRTTLVTRFRRAALETPDVIAIRYGVRTLTYAQLASRVERLAGYLGELGVAADHLVCVCCQRSIEQLIAVLGVWQAGAAMVPLDHSAPRQRLAFIVEETAAQLVLVTRESADRFDLTKIDLLVLDGAVADESWLGEYSYAPDLSRADALAYVLYTSGTTGRPKGVRVGQESLTNLETGLQRLLTDSGCTLPLRWAWNAPLVFDASLQALTLLTVGGQLYLLSEETRVDPRALLTYLLEHDIDLLDCTPSLLELLLAEVGRDDTALPHLLVGGEAIHERLWEAIADRMKRSGRVALNVYGPTETTVDATWAPIRAGTRATIGRPLANVEIRVLDEGLEEVPVGGVGECCIGGPGVARGYLARPDLSVQKFVSRSARGKARTFYRSGDLVRWMPDGQLAYLGRRDTQVKLRGYRVELGEIEQVILKAPGVTAAAVVVAPGGGTLTAYFVAGGLQLESGAVAAHCHEMLPEYMLPGAFVRLEAIPLTPSGKLDVRALPAPAAARQASARFAGSATEKRLERLWQRLLGAGAIDVNSNFFSLGGHSLLAIRLVSAVREELEVELPLAMLFRHPTLAELARVVDGLERKRKFPPVQVADRTRPLPLSFSQYRLWLIDRMEGRSPQYNMPAAYNLQGELNIDAYRRSLDFIVARHEALRTSYREVDGQAVQIVQANVTVPLVITDLTHLAPTERDAAVRAVLARDATAAFDLTADIMLRVKLLRLAPDRHVLVLNMHHIASDGWSITILMKELGAAYQAFANNQPPELAPLALQYADFSVWQRNVLTSAAIEGELEYWKEQLRGIPQLHSLPLDHSRPARQTYNGSNFVRNITPVTAAALRALATAADVTMFVVLETALAALLGRWSGQEDIVIGTAVAGRDDESLTPLIGFFLNTLVIRNDLSGNPSFRDLLERTRGTVLAAFEHRDVPFEMLVDSLRPERSLSHSPLFQILFVLHNQEHAELRLPGLAMTPLERSVAPAKFDLLLNAQEGEAGIELVWTYNTDLFLEETVQRLADGFEELIASAVADAQTRLAALNLLTSAQRHEILVRWNDTRQVLPAGQCLHELFVRQAVRTPARTALIDAEGPLSYGELFEQAQALSAALRPRLDGAECLVGVLLPKGRGQVVAALAIMMAAAAYLPLDVNWPKPRVNQILAHAQARLVVCLPEAAEGLWHDAVPIDPCDVPAPEGMDAQVACASFEAGQSPASLAYVIFTSGSTGTPKGVAIEHRSAVNTVLDINERFGVTAADRVLAVSALSFDLSVYDLFGLLAVGGCVVFPHERAEKDPAHWAELLELHHVTVWNTVPACAELLTAHFEYRRLRSETGLRVVMMSGDWIPSALPARIDSVFSGAQIHSLGGATEASIWSIGYPITADTSGRRSVPYGRPLANQSFYVLSDDLQPCPVGVAGQLHIGGVGLAREYYRDPVQTQASFIDHPVLGVRLYRTGDLGRYFPDGNIEFLGRKDQQVKIRGFRIELGEIEAVIGAHHAVEAAVVLVSKDQAGVQQLVAYCTLVDRTLESRAVVAELRRHVASTLPDYMVPAQYMILAALPLSANQKVDRGRLPEPEWQALEGRVESRGGTERMLLQLWQQVLGRETLHLDRNFFEAGGTSAHLIQIASRASALLQRKIAVVSFFEYPTIESLARFLDAQGSAAPAAVDVKRERKSRLAELRARRN
jgi:amino acid adenylation domain-containing protein